ncbi:heavy metal resistance protein [Novosphingobium barchaimii LL02]|uniref:Heavy metal resistance protein n=1 Tax=Novosphingobium barchaimii LL02 TaxID=1114963 RepID=A0A0J7XJN2_9SPHN|nr:periplasmic heavy metal sensor [Novosphingobium barchaimii]KMS51864.1 heavy metal resistance protein [Novosphingobium barchaimii LL02]
MARPSYLIVLFAFLAAIAGVFIGRLLFTPEPPIENRFHTLIHHELKLDAAQTARIEALERSFAARQTGYEQEMRDDNRRLAAAIQAEKGYGPHVADAVDRSHHAMGMLQKETLRHLFAMRAVLRPDQAQRFDKAMVDALTAPQQ